MCIVVKREQYENPPVAEKAMTAWKLMMRHRPSEGRALSLYQEHEWVVGVAQSAWFAISEKKIFSGLGDAQHFDSMRDGDDDDPRHASINKAAQMGYVFVGPGLHAMVDKGKAVRYVLNEKEYAAVWEVEIPEGTRYLLDEWGGVCAEQMTLVRKLKEEEMACA